MWYYGVTQSQQCNNDHYCIDDNVMHASVSFEYTLNSIVSVYHTYGNQSARDIPEFGRVNMDVWYHRISVACETTE